jgi:hypothetical protein
MLACGGVTTLSTARGACEVCVCVYVLRCVCVCVCVLQRVHMFVHYTHLYTHTYPRQRTLMWEARFQSIVQSFVYEEAALREARGFQVLVHGHV